MTQHENEIRINQYLEMYPADQLETLLRILNPQTRKYTLTERPISMKTALVELPADIVKTVMDGIRAAYPALRLEWNDGMTATERAIQGALERMKGGGSRV